MLPAIAGAAVAAAKSSLLSNVAGGISSLFGGETATDRRRVEHAETLYRAALSGDTSAETQLLYEAFERRNGNVGDVRTPRDGKYSPSDVRRLAKKALVSLYQTTGKAPPAKYAAELGIPVAEKPKPIGVQALEAIRPALDPIFQEIGDAAVDNAAQRVQDTGKRIVPYAIALGAIAVLVLVVVPKLAQSGGAK